MHELGHSMAAASVGYKLNKITLMPFGAVVSGNIDGLKPKDELKIALAGPFINLAIGMLFVAFWWIFPEIYAFTDIVVEANFSMALINFLPVFPLDGGRIASSYISQKHGSEKARKICKISGIIFAGLLFAIFVISCFYVFNLSFLFFSLFVLLGALDKNKENKYVKMYSALASDQLKNGTPYKKQAVNKSITIKRLITILDADAVNEIVVFDKEREIAYLNQNKIIKIIENGDLYSPISKYLSIK